MTDLNKLILQAKGWQEGVDYRRSGGIWRYGVPVNWERNIADAMGLAYEIIASGLDAFVLTSPVPCTEDSYDSVWLAHFGGPESSVQGRADTMERAICLAYLSSKGIVV